MKHFWALPAFLRLAIASQHQFNVFDDVLAYPQYEVIMAEGVLTEDEAQVKLAGFASRKDRGPLATEEPHPTPQSSLYNPHESTDKAESEKAQVEDDIVSYEKMVLNDRRYLCSIPQTPNMDPGKHNETRVSPEEEEKELVRASSRGWELLRSMDGNCLYFYSGWWSYSFCYGQGVRQFHQLPPGKGVPIYPPVEDKNVEAYFLGRHDDPEGGRSSSKDLDDSRDRKTTASAATETGLAKLEQKGDVRYLVQNLGGGTTCDLTGDPRRIEVQFRCQPNSHEKIALIKESTICEYLMIIDTPRLCNDVAFLPPQETKPYTIACTPVLPEAAVPSYLAAKQSLEAQAEAEDNRLTQVLIDAVNLLETGQLPPPRSHSDSVGTIEIGAFKLIPKDKKIEKGTIVGGGKEMFLATIARKGGWTATEKELLKLGIKGAKHLDELKDEVERAAAGSGWRLDVVDTPRGRELRGVIDKEKVGGEKKEEAEEKERAPGEGGEKEQEQDQDQQQPPPEGSEETYKDEL